MYELPAALNVDLAASHAPCQHHLFRAERTIHQRLLTSPLRTHSPHDAHYLYLPVYPACALLRRQSVADAVAVLEAAWQHVQLHHPELIAAYPTKHVWMFSNTLGLGEFVSDHACDGCRLSPALQSFIQASTVLQHFAPAPGTIWRGAEVINATRVISLPYDLSATLEPLTHLPTDCALLPPAPDDWKFYDAERTHSNLSRCDPQHSRYLASFHGKIYTHRWRGYGALPKHLAAAPQHYTLPRAALRDVFVHDADVLVVDAHQGAAPDGQPERYQHTCMTGC